MLSIDQSQTAIPAYIGSLAYNALGLLEIWNKQTEVTSMDRHPSFVGVAILECRSKHIPVYTLYSLR